MNLTNIRTHIQFSQYGEVIKVTYNGNKLQAMNVIKYAFGVKVLSSLTEYRVTNFLPEGNYTKD